MFQLAETTHSGFFRKPGKGEEWMKRGDLGQEQKPVHEKAGGWQNGPGGSSSNVPEVAKFNHNLRTSPEAKRHKISLHSLLSLPSLFSLPSLLGKPSFKTLPEAQRTQGIDSLT